MITLIKYILTLFVFVHASADASNKDTSMDMDKLEYIRTNYYASVEDEELVDKVELFINRHYSDNHSKYPPLILAYKAALQSVKSKHAFWPVTKLDHFNESMELFEKAVAMDPANLEIRFLRFTILHHVPSFLGHKAERISDMLVIIKELVKKDYSMIKPDIQKGIVEFMLSSGRLQPDQENKLLTSYPDVKTK